LPQPGLRHPKLLAAIGIADGGHHLHADAPDGSNGLNQAARVAVEHDRHFDRRR